MHESSLTCAPQSKADRFGRCCHDSAPTSAAFVHCSDRHVCVTKGVSSRPRSVREGFRHEGMASRASTLLLSPLARPRSFRSSSSPPPVSSPRPGLVRFGGLSLLSRGLCVLAARPLGAGIAFIVLVRRPLRPPLRRRCSTCLGAIRSLQEKPCTIVMMAGAGGLLITLGVDLVLDSRMTTGASRVLQMRCGGLDGRRRWRLRNHRRSSPTPPDLPRFPKMGSRRCFCRAREPGSSMLSRLTD